MSPVKKPWWRPSPAMVVALFAVFLAMGGTATALSGKFSVKRDDIAPKAVNTSKLADQAVTTHKIKPGAIYSKQIQDGVIGSYKLNLNGNVDRRRRRHDHIEASRSTSADRRYGEGAGRRDGRDPGAGRRCGPPATTRPGSTSTSRPCADAGTDPRRSGSNDFQTKYSAPGSGEWRDHGVTTKMRSGWIVLPGNRRHEDVLAALQHERRNSDLQGSLAST